MGFRTPLYARHLELGARMVDFGGWDMPLHYGSQLDEHHAVRRGAGIFDVSHMRAVDLEGARARAFLQQLLANDVAALVSPGKALYSCMLNENGGVVDDLIVYYRDAARFRLVVNAGTADDDVAWIRGRAPAFGVAVQERRELALIAAQGPQARTLTAALLPVPDRAAALALPRFAGCQLPASGPDHFIARTGYTGEDGFELMLPAERAVPFWDALLAAGLRPCGLGARNTLRLEAGMNLYGHDMDARTTPLEAGLDWTVAFGPGRAFVGRAALEAQRAAGVQRRLVGLVLEDKGVLRDHQRVLVAGLGEGEVTSGSWSPTLERSIALARVPAGSPERVQVDVRGRLLNARIVKPPFVRDGRARVAL